MKLSKSNRILLIVIAVLCIALLFAAVRLYGAAQDRRAEQLGMNAALRSLAEKMGRMYEAAAWDDSEWFERAVHEFQVCMQNVKAIAPFVAQTARQERDYRAARRLILEMPFVREESYDRMAQLPKDLQGGRFRTLYELLRDCCAETYDETMSNLAKDPRTAELLKSRGITVEG